MKFKDVWPALLILVAGIAGSIGVFKSSKDDSEQKNRIENLVKKIEILTNKIDKDARERKEQKVEDSVWITDTMLGHWALQAILQLGDKTFPARSLIYKEIFMGSMTVDFRISNDGQKNNYVFDFTILDEENNIIISMKRNKYTVYNNTVYQYKVTPTPNSFEVVSKDGMVVLSIQIFKEKIVVKGVFGQEQIDQALVIGDNEMQACYKNRLKLIELSKKLITPISR